MVIAYHDSLPSDWNVKSFDGRPQPSSSLEAAQIGPLLLARPAPPPDPSMGGRPRYVRGGRGRLERQAVLFDERHQASSSERGQRGVTVLHPGPPRGRGLRHPQPLGGPGSTSWRSGRGEAGHL